MANKYILPVYNTIFGEDFQYSVFEKRMKMQKAIYLLEQMGISVGDYGFTWYKHGPYSQQLQDDMHYESGTRSMKLDYTPRASQALEKLKAEFAKAGAEVPYDMANWVECIASLHYLKANILPHYASRDSILRELTIRKPHLNNSRANEIAYDFILSLA